MKAILALAVASMLPLPALAQATADSNSQSGANSQVILEGSEYAAPAPGMGGIGGSSTAPCIVAQGFGIVGPGAGIQYSGGRVDDACLTRTEAAMLRDLLDMRPTAGRQAAIAHACRYSERLRATLVAAGACVVRTR